MTSEQIKKEVLKYKWEYWADRRFGAFILSLFRGATKKYYKEIVDIDIVFPAFLFQKQAFYKSEEVWDLFEKDYLKKKIPDSYPEEVVRLCEKFQKEGREELKELLNSKETVLIKFEKLVEILRKTIPFVWTTHGLEHVYLKKMKIEAPKYYKGDIAKFIGDISFPIKKNEHNYFEEALASEMNINDVWKKYSWIKIRDGFSEGYSIKELEEARLKIKSHSHKDERFVRPKIPKELELLSSITQSLVYLRTLRTDCFYEFMYIARPILKEVAKHYNIEFDDLRHYDCFDLIKGNLVKHDNNICIIDVGGETVILDNPIYEDGKYENIKELKGSIAFKGNVMGTVKVVITAYEIGKVKDGDILVAPTTAPSYIIGMKKAGAFVTDEGGITSHAAIVAREMKKPCIIGTKIATKVLKDGDLVEVDANTGVVTILKNER